MNRRIRNVVRKLIDEQTDRFDNYVIRGLINYLINSKGIRCRERIVDLSRSMKRLLVGRVILLLIPSGITTTIMLPTRKLLSLRSSCSFCSRVIIRWKKGNIRPLLLAGRFGELRGALKSQRNVLQSHERREGGNPFPRERKERPVFISASLFYRRRGLSTEDFREAAE